MLCVCVCVPVPVSAWSAVPRQAKWIVHFVSHSYAVSLCTRCQFLHIVIYRQAIIYIIIGCNGCTSLISRYYVHLLYITNRIHRYGSLCTSAVCGVITEWKYKRIFSWSILNSSYSQMNGVLFAHSIGSSVFVHHYLHYDLLYAPCAPYTICYITVWVKCTMHSMSS